MKTLRRLFKIILVIGFGMIAFQAMISSNDAWVGIAALYGTALYFILRYDLL